MSSKYYDPGPDLDELHGKTIQRAETDVSVDGIKIVTLHFTDGGTVAFEQHDTEGMGCILVDGRERAPHP